MMKNSIFAIATLGVLATFVACSQETTEVSSTTSSSSYSTEADETVTTETVTTATVTTATIQDDSTLATGGEQIAEGAKLVGKGLKEEARQAVAASGAAMEQAGQALQTRVDAAAPPRMPSPAPAAAGDVPNGASIYKAKCASCHGADASGNTPIGKKNTIADLRTSAVQNLTDAELSLMITNGKTGGMSVTAHKSKALTPKQVEDVVAYVRSLRR